jgi:hypothetical protein
MIFSRQPEMNRRPLDALEKTNTRFNHHKAERRPNPRTASYLKLSAVAAQRMNTGSGKYSLESCAIAIHL